MTFHSYVSLPEVIFRLRTLVKRLASQVSQVSPGVPRCPQVSGVLLTWAVKPNGANSFIGLNDITIYT